MERRWLPPALLGALLLVVVLILVSGGGGGSGGSHQARQADPQTSPFVDVPEDAPLVARINTGPQGTGVSALGTVFRRLPSGNLAADAILTALLGPLGLDKTPVGDLFGNTVVVWTESATKPLAKDLRAAWVAADAGSLDDAISERVSEGALKAAGARGSYQVYTSQSGRAVGISGSRGLAAPSREILLRMLARRAALRNLSSASYDARLKDVPGSGGAVATISVTPAGLHLSDDTISSVTWLGALSHITAALVPGPEGLVIPFAATTGGTPVDAADLPFAAGTTSPKPLAPLSAAVTLALHRPSNAFAFAEDLAGAVAKTPLASLQGGFGVLDRAARIDTEGLLRSGLTGDVSITIPSGGGPFTLIGDLDDPEPITKAIQQLQYQGTLPDVTDDETGAVISQGFTVTSLGSDGAGFTLSRDDAPVVTVGVRSDRLIITNRPGATSGTLDALADSAPPPPLQNAPTDGGALLADATGDAIRAFIKRHFTIPAQAKAALGGIDHATVKARAQTDKVTGQVTFADGATP